MQIYEGLAFSRYMYLHACKKLKYLLEIATENHGLTLIRRGKMTKSF